MDVLHEIKRRLCAELATINPANGYVTDLGGRVFRGKRFFGAEDPLPFVSVIEPAAVDPPEFPPLGASGGTPREFDLTVQGFVEPVEPNETDAGDALRHDLLRCLERVQAEASPSGCVMGVPGVLAMAVGHGVVRPAEENVSGVVFVWIDVRFKIGRWT